MANDTSKPDNKVFVSNIIIRRSGVILGLYLIILEIVFLVISLIIRLPLIYFISSVDTAVTLYSVNTIIFIGLVFIKIVMLVTIMFQWVDNYYEIRPGRIIYKTGFIFRNEKEFDCRQISKINLSQNFLGKLFNFGTISLYEESADEWLFLSNIPNPHRNLRLVRKALANKQVEITISDIFAEDN